MKHIFLLACGVVVAMAAAGATGMGVAMAGTVEIPLEDITGRHAVQIREEAVPGGKGPRIGKSELYFKPGRLEISAVPVPGDATPRVQAWLVTNGKECQLRPNKDGKIAVELPETARPNRAVLRVTRDDNTPSAWDQLNRGKSSIKIRYGMQFGLQDLTAKEAGNGLSQDSVLARKVQIIVPYRCLVSCYHAQRLLSGLRKKPAPPTDDVPVWTWFRKVDCASYIDGIRTGSVKVQGNARMLQLPYSDTLWARNPPVVLMFNSPALPATGSPLSR